MAHYSEDGVYQNKNKVSNYTSPQVASGTAGYKWEWTEVPAQPEIVNIEPDYKEGAGTIGGPAKVSYFEVINDDLVKQYNVKSVSL